MAENLLNLLKQIPDRGSFTNPNDTTGIEEYITSWADMTRSK